MKKVWESLGFTEARDGEARPAPQRTAPAPAARPTAVPRSTNSGGLSGFGGGSLRRNQEPAFATIHTVRPTRYAEAEDIAITFREGSPMIIDLSGMLDSEVRRMIDFLSGLVKGLEGEIKRVSEQGKVYMLTPYGVDLVENAPEAAPVQSVEADFLS